MDADDPTTDTSTHDTSAGDDDASDDASDGDSSSLRQKLHWATGDRDKEAEALASRSGDHVTEQDAKVAVNRAHGDSPDSVQTDGPLATPEDAEDVREERT